MQWPVWRVAVAEQSMEPALKAGDWLLAWRGISRGKGRRSLRVKPGQIIFARHPSRPELLLVKRVAWQEPDGWWLSSDNPGAGAVDSAHFGVVAPELVEGRLLLRYWPAARRRSRPGT
jgi:nickel-type superoxide dismutase maturation protease